MAYDQEEREKEEARQAGNRRFNEGFNRYPESLEEKLADAAKQSGDNLLNTIMEVAERLQSVKLGGWITISEITPLKTPITYCRLRKLLKPHVASWWENRNKFDHSPVPFLKQIAESLLYSDWESVRVVAQEIPELLKSHKVEVQQAQASIDQQRTLCNQRRQELAVVQQVYATAKDIQQKALNASLSPPNEAELRREAEIELKSYGYSVCMVIAGICLIMFVITIPVCWFFAIKWGINANKMRKLTPEEFLPHVDEKVRLKKADLAQSQSNASEKADNNLATASQNLKNVEKLFKDAKEALGRLESDKATMIARQAHVQSEKLSGRNDPFMQMILDAP